MIAYLSLLVGLLAAGVYYLVPSNLRSFETRADPPSWTPDGTVGTVESLVRLITLNYISYLDSMPNSVGIIVLLCCCVVVLWLFFSATAASSKQSANQNVA